MSSSYPLLDDETVTHLVDSTRQYATAVDRLLQAVDQITEARQRQELREALHDASQAHADIVGAYGKISLDLLAALRTAATLKGEE